MVRLQELCGARPAEICGMRPCDIERRRDVWVYRPAHHKTEHKGNVRVIVLGPRAQRVLDPLLSGRPDDPVFTPAAAQGERGRLRGVAGEQWTTSNYGQAIRYAVKAARKAGVQFEAWRANQLRHSCGTRVRRKFGPAIASAVLGHSARGGARVTDTYTAAAIERETVTAASVAMRAIG
jgi:integrase